ncbi:NUDIX domain-containing protein [Antribacter sp. KLBMP9083]|uniref:NUDIX domain-containing protein n=1 Tax=Antribacter soli TaxID=2910976 RepID=A0AA41U910_9MICO|nr:NUDIX domain-containing protein [Antribacter soli]
MRFRVVPAVYVLLRREGPSPSGFRPASSGLDPSGGVPQVLLQLRQNTGYRDGHWAAAAAGHVERDESVLEAAVREVREELGIEVDPADLVPLTAMHRGERGGPAIEQRVDFFFETTRWSGTPVLQEADKAADLRWFSFVALPDPIVPHELAVLRAIHDGHVPPVMTFGF